VGDVDTATLPTLALEYLINYKIRDEKEEIAASMAGSWMPIQRVHHSSRSDQRTIKEDC
jgi:hypothetical protein